MHSGAAMARMRVTATSRDAALRASQAAKVDVVAAPEALVMGAMLPVAA